MDIAEEIKNQQRTWARTKSMQLSSTGYSCERLEDNLFQPMNSNTREEFGEGDGNELGGKMRALNSSSVLACNFFDYWRGKNAAPLAGALGVVKARGVCFEQKFSTGVSEPNLDVVVFCDEKTLFAIECKYSEPFYSGKRKDFLKEKYFPRGQKLWDENGLHRCQSVAQRLHERNLRYHHLDAAQLLKHMLGLANCEKNWILLYLWFNPGGPEAGCHEEEIKRFIDEVSHDGKVGGGGAIRAMTYQVLFKRMSKNLDDSHKEYKKYLKDRYFCDVE